MENIKFIFKDKNVVITGASKGIGSAIASAFLESGATVINISNHKPIEKNEPPQYTFVKKDMTDHDSIKKWIEDFTANNKKIDFWINNAGIYPQSLLSDTSEEDWDKTFATNLKSLFFASTYVASHMKKNKGGVIINASSFASIIPSSMSGVYAASKTAVASLTKSMAAEWAPYGIRVNSYCPGVILTDMTRDLITKKGEKITNAIALSRYGIPEEVANVVLFLCSDAASYITGSDIQITGGKFLIQDQRDIPGK